MFTFIESSSFERTRPLYLDEEEFSEVQQFMIRNPEAGEVIAGSGGVRKLRWRRSKMARKLAGKALAKLEAERDVWQEVLDGVREIKAGGGRRTKVEPRSRVSRVRLKSGLSQSQFAAALGVSKRTLEQWEQGRRVPSGAARTLLKIAERHPEVLLEVAG
jgi:putative transcriptional regulator